MQTSARRDSLQLVQEGPAQLRHRGCVARAALASVAAVVGAGATVPPLAAAEVVRALLTSSLAAALLGSERTVARAALASVAAVVAAGAAEPPLAAAEVVRALVAPGLAAALLSTQRAKAMARAALAAVAAVVGAGAAVPPRAAAEVAVALLAARLAAALLGVSDHPGKGEEQCAPGEGQDCTSHSYPTLCAGASDELSEKSNAMEARTGKAPLYRGRTP
jgi:hypothetical protein